MHNLLCYDDHDLVLGEAGSLELAVEILKVMPVPPSVSASKLLDQCCFDERSSSPRQLAASAHRRRHFRHSLTGVAGVPRKDHRRSSRTLLVLVEDVVSPVEYVECFFAQTDDWARVRCN